jgi:hypothetical protein
MQRFYGELFGWKIDANNPVNWFEIVGGDAARIGMGATAQLSLETVPGWRNRRRRRSQNRSPSGVGVRLPVSTPRRFSEGLGCIYSVTGDFTTGLLWRLARAGLSPAGHPALLGGTGVHLFVRFEE